MSPVSKRTRHRRRGQAPLAQLKRRLEADGLLAGREVVLEPAADEKMSAVLLAFIAPYKEVATSYEAYDRLIALAVLAWNAALLKAAQREDLLNQAMDNILASEPDTREDLKKLIGLLIERKEQSFSGNKRFIVAYELSEAKNDYHLSVASTL